MGKENIIKFKAKRAIKVSEIAETLNKGEEFIIESSDLSVQDDNYLVQFDRVEDGKEPERAKFEIKPGIFNIVATNQGLVLDPLEFKKQNLLKLNTHAETIEAEVEKFFSNLDVYDKYEIEKRRALLMFGPPGTGKSSAVTEVCNNLVAEDKGTVVINWNASSIESGGVLDFFTSGSKYHKSCTRLIFIIEDIGMSVEGYSGAKEVDRSLLNFLDGSGVTFRVPAFLMATTNYAENLPKNLVDRPGRFDKILKVGYFDGKSRVALLEFIMKTKLNEEDKKAIMSKECEEFSAAHLKEVFIRSKLDNTSIRAVVKALKDHSKLVDKAFDDGGSGSVGLFG